jgi:hypothetical protein
VDSSAPISRPVRSLVEVIWVVLGVALFDGTTLRAEDLPTT